MMATFTDTEIGDLVDRVRSWSPASGSNDAAFTYIDLSSVDKEHKSIVNPVQTPCADAPSRARQLVAYRDVLISTVRPNLNGVAAVPAELDGATASTGFCVLRPRPEKVYWRYLYHWVRSPAFVRDMTRKATGASYPAISDRIIHDSKIPLPELGEQQRIAAILDKADNIRRQQQDALREAQSLGMAIFLEMFGDISINDRDWEMVTVAVAGDVQLGRQRAPKYQSGKHTHQYMRVANVFEDRIDLGDVLSMDFDASDFERYKLEDGDILLNEGQSTELVGRPAIWRNELPNCCFQNTLVRFRVYPEKTEPEYALCVFLRYLHSSKFAGVSSKTSSVAHLGAARFARMPFPLPPLKLQSEFTERRVVQRRLTEKLEKRSIEAVQLFNSLVQRAFKGEL